ncbi:unnamed protein product [Orchesella dallaii]|uniref:C2H2-type domain-containing protein n=1 Tax=Orchesella dallaii TaxID=48710 RepID=A0ABP1RIX7_9HEXA
MEYEFDGMNCYKYVDYNNPDKIVLLGCPVCSYEVRFPQPTSRGASKAFRQPYVNMRSHIKASHRDYPLAKIARTQKLNNESKGDKLPGPKRKLRSEVERLGSTINRGKNTSAKGTSLECLICGKVFLNVFTFCKHMEHHNKKGYVPKITRTKSPLTGDIPRHSMTETSRHVINCDDTENTPTHVAIDSN